MANFSFKLEPKEAIAYLEQKGIKQSFNYQEIMYQAHNHSFTVAKVMRDDLLTDLHNSLLKAQEEGVGFKEWQDSIKPMLRDYGWYGKTEVTNPKTGEVKQIEVNSRRLQTIFNTNMRTAYAQSRYHKQKALPFSVYWMYVSMQLPTTRPSHAQRHGKVLHRDNPWWKYNYPPNGWGCKCKVRAYTKEVLEQKGIRIEKEMGDSIASSDWAYDLSHGTPNLTKLAKLRQDSIDRLPKKFHSKAKEELKIDNLYTKAIATATIKLQNYLLKHRPKIEKKETIRQTAHYNVTQERIVYNTSLPLATLRHELGHAIDHQRGFVSTKRLATLKIDQAMLLKNKEEISSMLHDTNEAYIHDLFYLNSNRAIGRQTRDNNYKITSNIQQKETFATLFEIILSNNQQRIKIIEQYFPNAYKATLKILERLE